MPVPIIIDCDPGHDDALAIMLAAADPAVDLLAITTVAGNQTLEKTTLNARRVCTIAGITDVPIAAGCARPLLQPLAVAEDVHGASGLDGPRFPEPTVDVVPEHAVDLIHRILLEHPEPVTLVPTAPLTNIALLLMRHPDSAARIREIVLMGGSTERGNRTPAAEFNIMTDPEAADIVFRSRVPLTMCGLNVTHQALATPEIRARFDGLGTELGRVCSELLAFFASTYSRLWGMPHPAPRPRRGGPGHRPGDRRRQGRERHGRTARPLHARGHRRGPPPLPGPPRQRPGRREPGRRTVLGPHGHGRRRPRLPPHHVAAGHGPAPHRWIRPLRDLPRALPPHRAPNPAAMARTPLT